MPARVDILQHPAVCADCGAALQPGEQVRAYEGKNGTTYYCLGGHKARQGRRQDKTSAAQAARPVAPASRQAIQMRNPARPQAPAQAQGWVDNPEALGVALEALSLWALDNNQVLRSLVAEVSRVAEALEALVAILISRGQGGDGQ